MEGEILAARLGPMLEKYLLKLVAIKVGSEISSPLLLKQEGQVSLDLHLLSTSLRIFHLVFVIFGGCKFMIIEVFIAILIYKSFQQRHLGS